MKQTRPTALLLTIYFVLSLSTFLIWNSKGRYSITGDEPHYLVMASGIARHGTLEQTLPYTETFKTGELLRMPAGSVPSPLNTHAVQGPHGLFNVHNVGLPVLISIPFLIGGAFGTKIFMIILGGFTIILVVKFSELFGADATDRFLISLATCIALPLIPGANQIYPDLLAGVIALSALYWVMTTNRGHSLLEEGFLAGLTSFLPWLHFKFIAASVLLLAAAAFKIFTEAKDPRRIATITTMASVSFIALVAYNNYAFGKFSGPYEAGSLQLSRIAFMVLLGLHFDQNHGFLLQNPVALIGLFSIGALFTTNKPILLLWSLVFLALIVPNALHPNWYGGASFSGRFAYAAAIVFLLPTAFGLARLARAHRILFRVAIVASLVLQACFFYQYTFSSVDLYNKLADTWLSGYPIFYTVIYSWMPALYVPSWAFSYAPNYAWLAFILSVLLLGFAVSGATWSSKRVLLILTIGLSFIVISPFIAPSRTWHIAYSAKDLPSHSGRVQGDHRVASAGTDGPGFVTFGPYLILGRGTYEVTVRYSSSAPADQPIGRWDIFDASRGASIAIYPLSGTAGEAKSAVASFAARNWNPHPFEFRTYWTGVFEIQIHDIALKQL